jgi:hypothetical protein
MRLDGAPHDDELRRDLGVGEPATVNELLIGPLVRCGAALPAVFALA